MTETDTRPTYSVWEYVKHEKTYGWQIVTASKSDKQAEMDLEALQKRRLPSVRLRLLKTEPGGEPQVVKTTTGRMIRGG